MALVVKRLYTIDDGRGYMDVRYDDVTGLITGAQLINNTALPIKVTITDLDSGRSASPPAVPAGTTVTRAVPGAANLLYRPVARSLASNYRMNLDNIEFSFSWG